MTPLDLKKFYSRFLSGHEGKLHFAAHSHHFWPDVTREAQLAYWDDCAKTSDSKWDKVFSEVIPKAKSHIGKILNLKDHDQIVFAPNTHELASRLLSLFVGHKKLSILTTNSEFHSWRRQILRLKELPEVSITMVPTDVREELLSKLKQELQKAPDLFYVSQVFFDSGLALTDQELLELAQSCPESTLMVVDGYHGFAAIPSDLSLLEGKIFYLAGGYKYGQGGEGAAFMVVPRGNWRPANTGWFAEFGELTRPSGSEVGYTSNGMAFMGATQDPSGLYRFNASWDLFTTNEMDVKFIHEYVVGLQKEFLKLLPKNFCEDQKLIPLYEHSLNWHGHFLTYESESDALAETTEKSLKQLGIIIDRRGKRLRFGFGLYQDHSDILEFTDRLKKLAPIF